MLRELVQRPLFYVQRVGFWNLQPETTTSFLSSDSSMEVLWGISQGDQALSLTALKMGARPGPPGPAGLASGPA